MSMKRERFDMSFSLCSLIFSIVFQVNGTYVLKSGTDFRQFSKVTLDFRENPVNVDIEAVDVTKCYEPDVELETVLEKYTGKVYHDF